MGGGEGWTYESSLSLTVLVWKIRLTGFSPGSEPFGPTLEKKCIRVDRNNFKMPS